MSLLQQASTIQSLQVIKLKIHNNKTFTPNSTYQIHLTTLLTSLNSTATTDNTRFHKATATGQTDTVYGLYTCEGDARPRACGQCVDSAIRVATSECRWSKEAIVWNNGGACMVRYANYSFFSKMETNPRVVVDSEADIAAKQRGRFGEKVEETLKEVVGEIEGGGGGVRFARKEAFLGVKEAFGVDAEGLLRMESVGECSWDVSDEDCGECLRGVLGDMKGCCVGKEGGAVMYPSCFLRFELDKDGVSPTRKAKGESWIIIIVVSLGVVLVLLSCFALYISRKKKSKSYKAILREYCK
ncbi:cysteine-rich receptor-like protein kinase 25 [Senna tora]|uniref:Cysteine-rich receptor-like protein kinase 25 n=1 Tax=Senna tora TaxID=362788 RepID=A0A835CC96_9FABA|nr:cysteine-rich receptor-like protein kinase 25 [Senna tora]